MIGFTLAAEIFRDDDEIQYATVLVSLDTDGDKPAVDFRIAGKNDTIATVDPEEFEEVATQIRQQTWNWRKRQQEVSA